MKLSVALFFAGLFGALAAVLILLSFGTDYWLLASETCQPDSSEEELGGVQHKDINTVSYHEGFFWGCYSKAKPDAAILALAHGFANRPDLKSCGPAYLIPYPPITKNETDSPTDYEPAIIYRGFWSIFMLISVATVVLGGFLIICAAPFASHCLYKTGGCLFLISGFFLLCCVVMFVLWFQLSDVIDVYVKEKRSSHCPDFQVTLSYGLSFMFAPIGTFFSLMAGLLFLLIGRTVKNHL
ncbi:transmembrane protein 182 [Kryptolebias marmoratus]|uniref:Transmembrane protein 182 n=1 Tax=Kryptolebias marmoratus TaxID=37003 RepID=A0A3Q2ZEZ3_KRYMA|nr:transmembrane protein 182 [Kryptolebias marmoratus]